MKKVELNKVEVAICATQEEFIEEASKIEMPESTKKDLPEIQILPAYNEQENKEQLFIVDAEDNKALISNIVRVLNSHQLEEAVGAAEDGNILSTEETDHMAFDFASDVYKLMDALEKKE